MTRKTKRDLKREADLAVNEQRWEDFNILRHRMRHPHPEDRENSKTLRAGITGMIGVFLVAVSIVSGITCLALDNKPGGVVSFAVFMVGLLLYVVSEKMADSVVKSDKK